MKAVTTTVTYDEDLPQWLDGGEGLAASLDRFYADMIADRTSTPRYFSPGYIQYANGHSTDYAQLLLHLEHIRRFSHVVSFSVEDAVSAKGVVAERHMVEMTDHEGGFLAVETSCFIRFVQGRIAEIYEVYRVVLGDAVMARFVAGA
jgi:hypothetical protein